MIIYVLYGMCNDDSGTLLGFIVMKIWDEAGKDVDGGSVISHMAI